MNEHHRYSLPLLTLTLTLLRTLVPHSHSHLSILILIPSAVVLLPRWLPQLGSASLATQMPNVLDQSRACATKRRLLSRSLLRSSCSSSLSSTLTFTSPPPSSSLVHARVVTLPSRCGSLPRCVLLFSRCPVSLLSFCWLLLVSSPPPSLELLCRFVSFFFVSCLFPLFFVAFTLPLVPSFLLLPLFLHCFTAHIKQQTWRRSWPSPIHPLCG